MKHTEPFFWVFCRTRAVNLNQNYNEFIKIEWKDKEEYTKAVFIIAFTL